MQHRVRHGIGRALAIQATRAAMESYSTKYGAYSPKTRWTSDHEARVVFQAKGITLEGSIEVLDDEVVLEMDIPFLLRPFQRRGLEIVEREIHAWCARAERGEL